LTLSLETQDDTAELTCQFDEDVVPHRWYPEFTLGKIVAELRRAFGPQMTAGPIAVHFAHAAPSYCAEYAGVFAAPVEFGRGQNALIFERSALETPIPTADPILNRLLGRQAYALLRAQPKRRSFLDRVRAVAEEELPRNSADQACVARRLAMSSATLRRRLEAHGSRYSAVVDEIRRELAAKHLTESKLGVDEISLRTGFAQTTAFYRAFRRWFGCTPAEYRRARAQSSWPPPLSITPHISIPASYVPQLSS
jgi:AraC-like DNA-binding protein